MFLFNPYAIPQFVTSIIFILLGINIFRRNIQSRLNQSFFAWCMTVFVWQFTYALSFSSVSEPVSLMLSRIGAASVFLLPSTYYYFISNFINSKNDIKISYGFFAIFGPVSLVTLFSNKLIIGVQKYYFGFHGRGSAVYLICAVVFLAPIVWTIYVFAKYLHRKDIELKKRMQSRYIFISLIVAMLASFDFLPKFGIEYYPMGWLFFIIWVISISYAMLAHNLLDINIVIKKGFVYSVSVGLITAIYSIIVLVTGQLFQGFIGYQSFYINLCIIFLIALFFNPLRDTIQHLLDNKYFHGTLESLDQEREKLQQELYQKEKLAYVGQLASSVVHEIRNPLTVIKTHIDYLPQKYQDPDFKEKFERLIPREIERLEKVVNQLLNLAKPRQVSLKPLNIISLIDSTLLLLEDNFTLKKIAIKREYTADIATISGDEEQLRQVFLNLFLNAIQAMGDGGELRIQVGAASHRQVFGASHESRATNPEKYIQIAIADTGCGISPEQLRTLFTPFQTTKKDGIGLGLSIAKEIIDLHGGGIEVESKLGEGTRFIISLPTG